MKLTPIGSATSLLVLLAACGAPAEKQQFNSPKEQACYERVSATLPADKALRRDSVGRFVEVTLINSQMRDVDTSEAFDACMAEGRVSGSAGDMGTVTFTAEELVIWNSLTDAAKKDALEFIRNGGTLKGFLAQ